MGEKVFAAVLFDGIGVIPVASDDDATAVEFDGVGKAALAVETAVALKGMGVGVVEFDGKELSDAERLFLPRPTLRSRFTPRCRRKRLPSYA